MAAGALVWVAASLLYFDPVDALFLSPEELLQQTEVDTVLATHFKAALHFGLPTIEYNGGQLALGDEFTSVWIPDRLHASLRLATPATARKLHVSHLLENGGREEEQRDTMNHPTDPEWMNKDRNTMQAPSDQPPSDQPSADSMDNMNPPSRDGSPQGQWNGNENGNEKRGDESKEEGGEKGNEKGNGKRGEEKGEGSEKATPQSPSPPSSNNVTSLNGQQSTVPANGLIQKAHIAGMMSQAMPYGLQGTDAGTLQMLDSISEKEFSTRPWSGCVVVGSSGKMIDMPAGGQIDKFETVIRTNNAPTEGYQMQVGGKTSIRVCNDAPGKEGAQTPMQEAMRIGGSVVLYPLDLLHRGLNAETQSSIQGVVSPKWVNDLRSQTIHTNARSPSTGFIAVALAVNQCAETVHVYGYGPEGKCDRYYGECGNSGRGYYDQPTDYHDFKQEAWARSQLAYAGRIQLH